MGEGGSKRGGGEEEVGEGGKVEIVKVGNGRNFGRITVGWDEQ